jgi:hypothetical protein
MEPSGDGLKVAYQGCPGAYSEAAAKKAYPSCHTVPCEYFETAFQVTPFLTRFFMYKLLTASNALLMIRYN